MPKFKVGDRVRVVRINGAQHHLEQGKIYTIRELGLPLSGQHTYRLKETPVHPGYYEDRFELVAPLTKFGKSLQDYLDKELRS